MTEIGDRVLAIRSSKDNTVYVYGYGVFEGRKVPDDRAVGFAKVMRHHKQKNPTILLDSGARVYGCECWWGSVEAMEKRIEGFKVVEVDIEKDRRKVT